MAVSCAIDSRVTCSSDKEDAHFRDAKKHLLTQSDAKVQRSLDECTEKYDKARIKVYRGSS